MFAVVGLAMATTLSLSLLTACDDDDDDDDLTETVDDDDDTTDDSSSKITGIINGYGYVDLGLSVKWATVNIGATLPADYGSYYAWGETTIKDEYNDYNSVTYGESIENFAGDATYDAATANWGSSWRMPTSSEFRELLADCTWTWTTRENYYGMEINGYLVEGTNGNSIFLPAAGYRAGSSLHQGIGTSGRYWSSSPNSTESCRYACGLYSDSDRHNMDSYIYRNYGMSVRPVSD